jgi:DNA (cytosine-5)-methyltransferase 1
VTFGELFAGIGGFSLGLERAGMTCKWQVEIDPYATAVLRKHWPDVPKHDDVRTFPPTHTHTQDFSVDLICGGFPCQDISVAGKGAGLAGERSGLWNDFARIIRTVRPRWVVIENVPALTARGLGTVLRDLAEIGFDAEWHCIPASAVGAPHRRERIWIVGNARCEPIGGSIAASAAERGEAIAPASPVDTGDAGCGRTYLRSSNVAVSNGNQKAMRRQCANVPGEVCCGRGNPRGGKCHSGTGCEGCSRESVCDVSDADSHGPSLWRPDERVGRQRKSQQAQADGARRLTDVAGDQWVTEPDVGRVAHGIPSRVDRLRCLGNAVVPQVVEVIGRAILDAEARMNA